MHSRLLVLSLLLVSPFALAEEKTTEIPPGHLFKEPATGLLFGRKLNDLEIIDHTIYASKTQGASVRYEHPEGTGEKVDIYIYTDGLESISDAKDQAQSKAQIQSNLEAVKIYAERGYYKKVDIDPEQAVHSAKLGDLTVNFLRQSMSMEHLYPGPPEEFIPFVSNVTVGTYKNHFIKIRHSLPASLGEEKCLEKQTALIKTLIAFINEDILRPDIEAALKSYAKDPVSKEGRVASAAIFAYAKASEVITVRISPDHLPWLKTNQEGYTEDEFSQITADLMSAFIAGQINQQLKHTKEDPYPGILTQINVYQRLRKNGTIKNKHPVFENWIKMKAKGTLQKHIASLDE